MKRILITGAGNLGLALYDHFDLQGRQRPFLFTRGGALSPTRDVITGDIVRRSSLEKIFSGVRPDAVIHTAAMTDVDMCEREPGKAFEVNSGGTGNVVSLCEDAGIPLVYISTDYVFDGRKGDYREEDEVFPINVYGKSKLAGENAVRGMPEGRWAIVRTSFLYNPESPKYDFLFFVAGCMTRGERIQCDDFRFTKPTPCHSLGSPIEKILMEGRWGTYHIAGGERLTPFEIARAYGRLLDVDCGIVGNRGSPLEGTAPRPVDPTLNTKKAERELGFRPPSMGEGLGV